MSEKQCDVCKVLTPNPPGSRTCALYLPALGSLLSPDATPTSSWGVPDSFPLFRGQISVLCRWPEMMSEASFGFLCLIKQLGCTHLPKRSIRC